MASVGENLRASRESRGLSVSEVAEETKIMAKHISDLEEGQYNGFSAPVYIRGFVRSYAALLKLDVPKVMAQLDEELSRTDRFREPPSLTGRRRGPLDFVTLQLSRLNWKIVAAVASVVALILCASYGYRIWRDSTAHDPLTELGPGLYKPAPSPSVDVLPLTNPPARR